MTIREVSPNDARAICDIYNDYVRDTAISFETEPVTEHEMEQRIGRITIGGYPFYVGETGDGIAGYAYINRWNNRCAYTSTAEITIYLDKDKTGKGYGTLLYDHLLKNIDRQKIHVLIAGICIPNDESIRLHEKFGFRQVSCMKEIGYKLGQWRDVGHWQLIF